MKNSVIIGILLPILFFSITTSTYAAEKESLNLAQDAKSAILMERDTGEVLYEKEVHEKLPPASMTKVMTLLLIMEEIDQGNLKLDEKIRISERAASMGGSQIFLAAGEEMIVEDLLKGIAISSGNDASVALAERIAGSEAAFVEKMNEKAEQLSLENTQFQNASGLPAEEHYSTAYDMSIIAKELLKYEEITKYTSIYEDYLRKGETNEFWLVNTNKLVRFYPGVDGLKTGYTNEAKYCLTATAKKDDMRVITVVMGADTVKKRNATVSQLLDYAFNHYRTEKLYTKGDTIKKMNLLKAEKKFINIVASESVSTLHKKGESTESITTETVIKSDLSLPIKKGTEVGVLHVKRGEKTVVQTPLIVDEDVNYGSLVTLFNRSIQNVAKES